MVKEDGRLPEWLSFLSSPEPAALGLLWQLLVVEFLVDGPDGLRHALLGHGEGIDVDAVQLFPDGGEEGP